MTISRIAEALAHLGESARAAEWARWQAGEHSISVLELVMGFLGVLVVAGVVFIGPLCIALLIRASIWRTYLTFLLTLASVQTFMICVPINVESMHRAHRWRESLK